MSWAILQLSASDAYSLWAATYDESSNALLALERRIVDTLLPDLEGLNVLDLACGIGRWLKCLLQRGAASVLGIDPSIMMLK